MPEAINRAGAGLTLNSGVERARRGDAQVASKATFSYLGGIETKLGNDVKRVLADVKDVNGKTVRLSNDGFRAMYKDSGKIEYDETPEEGLEARKTQIEKDLFDGLMTHADSFTSSAEKFDEFKRSKIGSSTELFAAWTPDQLANIGFSLQPEASKLGTTSLASEQGICLAERYKFMMERINYVIDRFKVNFDNLLAERGLPIPSFPYTLRSYISDSGELQFYVVKDYSGGERVNGVK